jgi:hypothetical protein
MSVDTRCECRKVSEASDVGRREVELGASQVHECARELHEGGGGRIRWEWADEAGVGGSK